MKRGYVDIPEGQMHYRAEGEGETVLLLHMSVASSDEFTRTMHYLSASYHAVAPDFLGTGDSDPAPSAYNIQDHAATIINFMDALNIRKANIVGHHLGATVGIEVQLSHPEMVSTLILSGFGYHPDPEEGIPFEDPPDFMGPVEIKPDGSHLLEWWRRSGLWGGAPEILEERVIEYIKAGPRGEEQHWAGQDYDVKTRLPLVNCPMLIIFETKDPFFVTADAVKKLVPAGKFTVIKDGPIYVDRTMPKEFAQAVLNFLESSGK
jgi:pimeloyl-ACP methyl ester carboxylesterase